MRWFGFCIGLIAVVFGVVNLTLGLQISNLHGQIDTARVQFAQQERSDRQAQVSLSRELVRAEQELAAASARIGGTHRDLITCADWQGLFLPVSGVDSFNGQLSASAGPPSLPSHCVNQ